MKHTKEQIELSESLLAACKAAGIEKLMYFAQDENGSVYSYQSKPYIHAGIDQWLYQNDGVFIEINHPPYADDWKDSLLEWVEPVKDFNITPAEAMTKWRESFAFTEAQKQAIEDHAVAENEPLADVLARHPESEDDACKIAYRAFMSEDHRTITGFPRAADIYEQAWQDALKWKWGSEQASGIDPYKVQVGGVTLDPYMIASIYGINDPIIFQMIKKLLRFGRKHKDATQDVLDTITSAIRWLEINSPESAKVLIESMAEKGRNND